jgi:hypothetical protein
MTPASSAGSADEDEDRPAGDDGVEREAASVVRSGERTEACRIEVSNGASSSVDISGKVRYIGDRGKPS